MDEKYLEVQIEPLLLGAAEAAKICGISKRFWNTLDVTGRNPMPIRLGSRVL